MKDLIYHWSEIYNSNDTLRSLIKLIPTVGSTIDFNLNNFYTKEKERRLTEFFDELEAGKIYLTEEVIQSDVFLHKYFITLRAVIDTKRSEKIKYFARLFSNSEAELINNDADYFEDFVKVLDDLSYLEIYVLLELREFEKRYPYSAESKFANNRGFHKELVHSISEKKGMTENEVKSLFLRLERTGCIQHNYGGSMATPSTGSIASTDFLIKLETFAFELK